MTPNVAVPDFEGPLGLLIELVEGGKMEATAIAVGAVTRQYLDRVSSMSDLSHQDLAQFLELGARLVHIKSLALLPDAGDTETPLAELRQLNQELAEYQLFQAATGELKTRLATGQQSYVRTNIPRLAGAELPKPELDLAQLGAVFSDALARSKPASQTLTTSHRYDQAEITARLRGRLEHGKLALSEIITACHDRGEIIITFLAILELIRGDSVTVKQERSFDDMMLVATP